MQFPIARRLVVGKLDQHVLHGPITLGIPGDHGIAVAGAVVAAVIYVFLLIGGNHSVILGLNLFVAHGHIGSHGSMQVFPDTVRRQTSQQGFHGQAVLVKEFGGGGHRFLIGFLGAGGIRREVALVLLHIAVKHRLSLSFQSFEGFIIQFAQSQFLSLRVQNRLLDHAFQQVCLDVLGVAVGRYAVLAVHLDRGVVLL